MRKKTVVMTVLLRDSNLPHAVGLVADGEESLADHLQELPREAGGPDENQITPIQISRTVMMMMKILGGTPIEEPPRKSGRYNVESFGMWLWTCKIASN